MFGRIKKHIFHEPPQPPDNWMEDAEDRLKIIWDNAKKESLKKECPLNNGKLCSSKCAMYDEGGIEKPHMRPSFSSFSGRVPHRGSVKECGCTFKNKLK